MENHDNGIIHYPVRQWRGWIPAGQCGEVPALSPATGCDPAAGAPPPLAGRDWRQATFSPDRRARFLDVLAEHGNVRIACAAVRISPETAYRLRRRDFAFAEGWQAALVLARGHVEQVLADRALNGVEEEIWYRGELVGSRRRHDSRLLLAHLGRLDRLADETVAGERAERFDEMLALVAGERFPDAMADADAGVDYFADPLLPMERDRYLREAEQRAAGARWWDEETDAAAMKGESGGEGGDGGGESRDGATIVAEAAAEWDDWQARARAVCDTLDAERVGPAGFVALDSVNSVNTPAAVEATEAVEVAAAKSPPA